MTRDAEHTPSPHSVVVPVSAIVGFDVEEYVGGYEFRGDEGGYMPTDKERELITDAIHGVMSELSCLSAPAPSSLAGGEVTNDQIQSVMLAAIKEVRATVTDATEGACMDADIIRMESGLVDMGDTGWAVMRAVHRRLAALSPEAPAREGVSRGAECKVGPDTKGDCSTRAGCDCPALTPRHEAPAALCDHGHTDPMALCSDCEAASVEAPAEGAGEMDDDDASTYAPSVAGLSDYLWNQAQAADSVEGRCILEMWREAVDALRARSSAPEAREDKGNHDCLAKRRDGEPMFILLGRDPDAHTIVQLWADRRLAAGGDPDHCRMGYDTAERMKAYASDPANRPASAPDASDYPAAPSADKLRIAVEALEKIERWHGQFPETGKFWPNEDKTPSDRPVSYSAQYGSNGERDFMRSVARQALAALKGEEK